MRSCRRRDCARRGLDEIIRQKDPALKEVVEQLARGDVREAISNLNGQGRVHEIGDRSERIAEIAREYVRQPENTLVVSPDNESRREINSQIHRAMQGAGQVKDEEHAVRVLNARQELTGADRQHARNYEASDVIRYSKGSKLLGLEPGEYAKVVRTNEKENTVTVERTERRGAELRPAPVAGRDGLSGGRAHVRRGRPGADDRAVSRAEAGKPGAGDGREDRRQRQSRTAHGLRPRGRVQHPGSIRISTTVMR